MGLSCHSEEWNDEESLTMKDKLGMRGTLRYAQSDKITERINDHQYRLKAKD